MRQGNVSQAVQDDVLAKMSKFDFACRSKDGAAASAARLRLSTLSMLANMRGVMPPDQWLKPGSDTG